jgi:hypothetical protein
MPSIAPPGILGLLTWHADKAGLLGEGDVADPLLGPGLVNG